MTVSLDSNETDIFSGCGNGTLTLAICQDPQIYNPNTDIGLNVCINDDDLEAISLDIFQSSTGKPYEGVDNILVGRNRNRKLFQESFPAYPMLSKINYMYEDALFNPQEVKTLREECIQLKTITTNSKADLAFRKLIYACDKAIEVGFYLDLSCD